MNAIGRDAVVAYQTGRGHVPHQAVVLGASKYTGKIRVRVTWFPAGLVSDRDVPLDTLTLWDTYAEQAHANARLLHPRTSGAAPRPPLTRSAPAADFAATTT